MRIICLILCLALLCGGAAAQGKTAMGRYVEQPRNFPGEGSYALAQAGDKIYALASDISALYESVDGLAWAERAIGHDPTVCPLPYVSDFCLGPDGSLYLASNVKMEDGEAIVMIERIAGGVPQRVPLELDPDKPIYASDMAVAQDGGMLLLDQTAQGRRVLRFSAEGKLVKQYPYQDAVALAVHGSEMAVYDHGIGLVTITNLDTGEVTRKFDAPEGADYAMPLAYGPDGTLTMATKAGLYTVTPGGTLMTQMLDGSLTSLGKPTLMAGDLVFDGEGDPVIAFVDMNTWQYSLFGYKFDETIPTEPTSQISVFALYDDDIIREAIALTQARHPEVKVNLEVALPEGTAITRDDAIRTLNTQILAGKGPDVIVLDGLPIQSYIDKGVLLDLSNLIGPLMDEGQLAKSVATAFAVGGAIPAVPTRFLLPTLWGDLTGIHTLEDLAAWATQHPDQIPIFAMEPGALIDEFYLSCAPAWAGEDGRLDEERLAQFLTLLKAIRGHWTGDKVEGALGDDQSTLGEAPEAQPTQWNPYRKVYNHGMIVMPYAHVAKGQVRLMPYVLRGMEDAATPNGVIDHLPNGAFMAMPGQAQGVYMPYLVLGINAGSGNAHLAQAFVLQMLSDPVQSYDPAYDGKGFPVNQGALDVALSSTQRAGGGSDIWSVGDMTFECLWLSEGQRAQLGQIIKTLQTPSLPDFALHQMIVELSAPFFEGTMDAGQAAAAIAAKANAYLSE